MDTIQYNQLLSFIWNIASDVLVNVFEKGDYKKVIMPFLVLRRIDVLLEPTKQKVIEKKKWIDEKGLTSSQDEILFKVTKYPFYNTSNFTLRILKSEGDPKQLHKHFIEYLDGFSSDVIDIIDKFKLKQIVENLTNADRLGSIIDKFTDERYNLSNKPILDDNNNVSKPALDNHTMGTIFEELLRRFNEENNVTEAGEHFTPRDYVKLMADLAVIPVADKITDNTYHIYDAACGTGGILTIAQERIEEIAKEHGKQVLVKIFGQEQQPDTYATCKAELMISGHIQSFHYQLGTEQKDYIAYDSTLSRDGHKGETFDFCISNPPFGIPWIEDIKKWGVDEKKKKDINDSRFTICDNGKELSFIPNIDDSQMLFLANNISRMREDTALGTRIVEVHDGSSLFSGDAGSGPSNLRKYIIENDMLEAIIAMPENDFYNAKIGTFIWVLTNKKEPRRKGYIQFIDATEIKTPLRRNLGKKNCETTKKDREKIMKLYMDFKPTAQCKIFPNEEFGYWCVNSYLPLYDSNDNVLNDQKGQPLLDKNTKDTEYIPFTYGGGIDGYFKKEVKPYVPDAYIDYKSVKIGYRLSFASYFDKFKDKFDNSKTLNSVKDRIITIENNIKGLLDEILYEKEDLNTTLLKGFTPNIKTKASKTSLFGDIPEHWEERKMKYCFFERSEKNHPDEPILCATQSSGVIPQTMYKNRVVVVNKGFENLKFVKEGDFVISLRSFEGGIEYAYYQGIISAAYTILTPKEKEYTDYYKLLFKSRPFISLLQKCVKGIREGQNINYQMLGRQFLPIPPLDEQRAIVAYVENKCKMIDTLSKELRDEIESLNDLKKLFLSNSVTGRINRTN